jgi:nucleotide-binding universal stress UspA family protein
VRANIVVGIDGSVPSRAALEWCITRAKATGESVELLCVVDHPLDSQSDAFVSEAVNHANALLASEALFARKFGIAVMTRLGRGDPFDGLVAASRSAGVLVVGTHKTGFIQGRSIGSRFMGLAAMSRCPIAYIPNVSLISRRGVSLAVDDSPTGRRAAVFAATEAHRLSQRLTLLHAEPWHVDPAESAKARTERELVTASRSRTLISNQLAPLTDAHPTLATKSTSTRKSLAVEAIDASMTAALVVISHPHARASIGSESGRFVHDVILNLGGPVVVVPQIDADDGLSDALGSALSAE